MNRTIYTFNVINDNIVFSLERRGSPCKNSITALFLSSVNYWLVNSKF